MSSEYAFIPEGGTTGNLPPGGLTVRIPKVEQPHWSKQEEEADHPLLLPVGRNQTAAADEKKTQRRGEGKRRASRTREGKAAREATARPEPDWKAAKDAEDDIKREETAAVAAAKAKTQSKSDEATSFSFRRQRGEGGGRGGGRQ